MGTPIRRLITGHDKDGKAVCIKDGAATCTFSRPQRPGVTLTNLWQSDTSPAEFDGPEETVAGPLLLNPPANGAVFRIVEFEPEDPEVLAKLDGKDVFAQMGAAANVVDNARHPFMHRTDTIDYGVVIAGEIYLMLDEDEHLLKAGDTFVQRGTNHAWSNRGTETCRIAFVLIDGIAQHGDK